MPKPYLIPCWWKMAAYLVSCAPISVSVPYLERHLAQQLGDEVTPSADPKAARDAVSDEGLL